MFIGKKPVIYKDVVHVQEIKFKHTVKSFRHSYRKFSVARDKSLFCSLVSTFESAFGRDGQLPLENARLVIPQLRYLGNRRFALNKLKDAIRIRK